MSKDTMCQTGECRTCGALYAASVDDAQTDPKSMARFVAQLARDNALIERHSVAYVRVHLAVCNCGKRRKKIVPEQLSAL